MRLRGCLPGAVARLRERPLSSMVPRKRFRPPFSGRLCSSGGAGSGPRIPRLYRPVAASDASTEALERSGMPRAPAGEETMGFCGATPIECDACSLLRRSAPPSRIGAKPAFRPISSLPRGRPP